MIDFHLSIISTRRSHNVEFMQQLCDKFECFWYVNDGELSDYLAKGAYAVIETGDNICAARNAAIMQAESMGLPCIQISDDLRSMKRVWLDVEGKRRTEFIDVATVSSALIKLSNLLGLAYGGVAINNNPLNYKGDDLSTDKLIVNDFICVMPGAGLFDETLALKEDYDMSIRHLLDKGVLRMNNILCDFPHRDNIGGANEYRNDISESIATRKLMTKWPNFIRMNKRRPGQVLLDYKAIRNYKQNSQQEKLFDI